MLKIFGGLVGVEITIFTLLFSVITMLLIVAIIIAAILRITVLIAPNSKLATWASKHIIIKITKS